MLDSPRGHPGRPPLTTPWALLRWLAHRQAAVLGFAIALTAVNFVAMAVVPLLLGTALDQGLTEGLSRPLLVTGGWLLGVGVVQALTSALAHVGEVGAWMHGALRTSRLVGHHVTRTGDAISEALPTGEVVATVATDAFHIGNVMEILPRFVGSVLAYLVVAVLLVQQSVTLGVAVLVGLPVTTAILALGVRPLHARQAVHREASGRLTTLGSDTVAGLRVLRGIGGEEVFTARYAQQSQRVRAAAEKVAATQSVLEALQVLLPGLLVVGVVWLGAHLALRGEITPGQLVTFYGYTAFLSQPLRAATQFFQMLTRARVGAGKVMAVLKVTPAAGTIAESERADTEEPVTHPWAGSLVDTASGITFTAGRTTALVSAHPEESAALATRLGRFDDAGPDVLYDGVPLRALPLAEVRRRVVVVPPTPQLFTGTLREELDVRERAGTGDLHDALTVADAQDVLDSLQGLDGEITEKGRSLSGGQRQRVALARALLAEAETLVLVEPTSAVDAHTEARIAARIAAERRGRTTVVVTASPLVLDRMDEVVLVEAGRERIRGSHRDLLARAGAGEPGAVAYAAVVSRAAGDPTDLLEVR